MNTEAIVIRIKTPSGDMDSSVDCPSLLNFNDLLVSLPLANYHFSLIDTLHKPKTHGLFLTPRIVTLPH